MNDQITNSLEKQLVEPVSSSRRFLNFLIDLTIWGSVLMVINLFIDLTQINNSRIFNFSLLSVTFLIYYFAMELIFQRTVGKFVTKTKVVNEDGEKPTPTQIIFRTLCRLIPFDQFSFLVVRKGFHDYLSNTMVVDESEITNANIG